MLARSRPAAFTILELLIVISIIIVLAGLILATGSYVQKKGARSRAEAEIAAMSAALENYKADNGVYPSGADTVALDARQKTNPDDYKKANLVFYELVSGDSNADGTVDTKAYFSFKPNQLVEQNQQVAYIRDPFGNAYGYSTIANPTVNPAASATAGYNPTFDLWSTGGTITNPPVQTQWIKNW